MSQTTLNWQYDGPNPESFSVYRSATPMDPEALPTPLAVAISGALRSYVDSTVTEGSTYYYRVSAIKGSVEKVSEELEHVAEVAGDPSWLGVKSLLKFEGADGGTTFTDQIADTTWGNPNMAITSTEQFKFGTSAYKGTSTGQDSRIQVTGGGQLIPTNLTFFTIECWIYLTAYSMVQGSPIFSQSCSGGGCEQFFGVTNAGRLVFYRNTSVSVGNGVTVQSPADGDVPLNQWVHVAVTFDGRRHRLFINGVKKATGASTVGWANPGSGLPQYFGHVLVGNYPQNRSSLRGYADAFRLTNDCRYINDFAVATEAHPVMDRVVMFEDTFDTDMLSTNYIRVEDTEGTMMVSGGALTITTNGAYQSKLSPQSVYFADGYVEGDFTHGDDAGLVLRMRGRDNYYQAAVHDASSSVNPGTAALYKKVNGAYTQVGSRVVLPAAWTRGASQTFRFSASGTTLTLTQNGATVFSLTDSEHPHGRVAVRGNGSSGSQTVCQRLAASG